MKRPGGIIIGLLLLAALPLQAQSGRLSKADSLHRALRFQEAIQLYQELEGEVPEQVLQQRISASQNGLNMTELCAHPHVVARQKFSRKNFFLYYPLASQAWHPSPNPLDSLEGYPLYLPKEADQAYFSAVDRGGSRSLFFTEDLDSTWRAPGVVSEKLLSTGSEIFPMLSPDGQTLYFASDGLHGMGGFDLYSAAWDPETGSWGEPVNMGFPYSSPGDDFLLVDSEDGKYTLFASNRDCGADSVYVYVLEYAGSRSRMPIYSPEQLQRISRLAPVEDPTRIDNAATGPEQPAENANTRLYKRKMEQARELREAIGKSADPAVSDSLRQRLEEVNLELRLVEESFLRRGIASEASAAEREVVGAQLSYTFSKHAMGGKLKMKVAKESVPATFDVMPIGRFSPETTLPEGLVYQIEFLVSPRHVSVEALEGLSPVYERLSSSLRYTYSVGMFTRYSDALLQLNRVRCLGFPTARITAWRDGRPIPVPQARGEE